LIEREHLAAGATGRNGGFVVAGTAEAYPAAIARHGHATARDVWALTLDSRALLRQALEVEAIRCDYREPGHIHLALNEEQWGAAARTVAAIRADGFAAELLDRQQAQALIDTPLGPEIVGGLFAPEDWLLNPAQLVSGLAAAARRRGARICCATTVTGLAEDDGVLIATTRGHLRAGAAIVATNAWTGQIAPALADLITPVRGQVLCYAPSAPVFGLGMGAAATPTGEYWQQAPDGTIVLGGCRAVAPGLDVAVPEQTTTADVQAALEGLFPRLFPDLGSLRVARRWAGLMAFTPDYLPIVDRAPGTPNVWVVGGFCGHGMPFGMRFGQLLAEAATSGSAPAALAPFRLDRPTLQPVVRRPSSVVGDAEQGTTGN
jgi:glycine/D-amino acid oxidase-like deaminating enzyme